MYSSTKYIFRGVSLLTNFAVVSSKYTDRLTLYLAMQNQIVEQYNIDWNSRPILSKFLPHWTMLRKADNMPVEHNTNSKHLITQKL